MRALQIKPIVRRYFMRASMLKSIGALSLGLLGFLSHAAPSECQADLLKLLSRMSNEKSARVYQVNDARPVSQLKRSPLIDALTQPSYESDILLQGKFKYSVANPNELVASMIETQKKGFWLIYNPSGPQDRVQTGHFAIVVGDTLFNRMGDNLGQTSMSSTPLKEVVMGMAAQGGLSHPFVVAQHYELSESATGILSKFFHNRVWSYHDSTAAQVFRSQYHPLPQTRGRDLPNAENCLSFALSFMDEKFLTVMPELAHVRREVGTVRATQIPARQFRLNTEIPAYRGSLIVANDPDTLVRSIESGDFNQAIPGNQMLFDGPAHRLRTPLVSEDSARMAQTLELLQTHFR